MLNAVDMAQSSNDPRITWVIYVFLNEIIVIVEW